MSRHISWHQKKKMLHGIFLFFFCCSFFDHVRNTLNNPLKIFFLTRRRRRKNPCITLNHLSPVSFFLSLLRFVFLFKFPPLYFTLCVRVCVCVCLCVCKKERRKKEERKKKRKRYSDPIPPDRPKSPDRGRAQMMGPSPPSDFNFNSITGCQ